MLPINRKRLGLIVSQPDDIECLTKPLRERNWLVTAGITLSDENADMESLVEADVLIVDLGRAEEEQFNHLNDLIAREFRPVLFNDAEHDKDWLLHLISKLEELPEEIGPGLHEEPVLTSNESEKQELPVEDMVVSVSSESQADVWLISASLGGPKVLRDLFLALLPELPVCFLVTQRIAIEHIDTLVNYLSQYSRYEVSVLADTISWDQGKVILIPDGYCFSFDASGNMQLIQSADYNGDELDSNIAALAERYGQHAGVMVLSAVSEQGVKGCSQLLENGGRVWLHNDLPQYFDQFAELSREDDSVISGSAVALAERLNTLYAKETS